MKISISKRKLKDGRTSLYLDIHAGRSRKRKCLGIYLYKGNTDEVKIANRDRLIAARKILLDREMQLICCRYNLEMLPILNPEQPPYLFNKVLKTYREYIKKYPHKDIRIVKGCYRQLELYWNHRDRSFLALTRDDVSGFWNFLCTNLHGATPANYFSKFRGFISSLLAKEWIKDDPTSHIKLHYSSFRTKDALQPKEIQLLMQTPWPFFYLKFYSKKYLGFFLLQGTLLTACGGRNMSEDRPVSEVYYFEAQDTTQVLSMCDKFMSMVQERDYDHAFAQLYYFVDNQPVQVPLSDMNALKEEFEHFPILDFNVETSEFITPDNVTITYKVRFMDKPADEPNFPDSYRIVFAPERINDTWYLGMAEHAKQ